MRYARHAARLYNRPLLITPEKAQAIETVFRAYCEGRREELEQEPRKPKDEGHANHAELLASGITMSRAKAGYLVTDTGVGVVQVFGTLVQRGDSLDAMSGLMGYNRIGAQLAAAMDDSSVDGILMEFDSPGGEVAGCFDLARKIVGYGQSKPIWAIANEIAMSAAYALASAASELYMPMTGLVGSVGVMMLHVDQSQLDAKVGLKFTPIFAGRKKNDFSPHEPLSARAHSDAQTEVNRYYDIFVSAVASARGIDEEVVRATEAGVLNPVEAKQVGFADGTASFSEALNAFSAAIATKTFHRPSAAAIAQPSQELDMTDATKGAAPAANAVTNPITPEQLADARTAGFAEGRAAGIAEGAKAARVAERARIGAITSHAEAAGREKLAAHIANSSEMSVEDAAAFLAAAPKEAAAASAAAPTNRLAAAMDALGNPKVGADAPAADAEEAEGNKMLDNIVAIRNAAYGKK